MKRYTKWDQHYKLRAIETTEDKNKLLSRLAQYEDIGYYPEELRSIVDEYNEFMKYKEEGRLVVLPYRIGDRLYSFDNKSKNPVPYSIHINSLEIMLNVMSDKSKMYFTSYEECKCYLNKIHSL